MLWIRIVISRCLFPLATAKDLLQTQKQTDCRSSIVVFLSAAHLTHSSPDTLMAGLYDSFRRFLPICYTEFSSQIFQISFLWLSALFQQLHSCQSRVRSISRYIELATASVHHFKTSTNSALSALADVLLHDSEYFFIELGIKYRTNGKALNLTRPSHTDPRSRSPFSIALAPFFSDPLFPSPFLRPPTYPSARHCFLGLTS